MTSTKINSKPLEQRVRRKVFKLYMNRHTAQEISSALKINIKTANRYVETLNLIVVEALTGKEDEEQRILSRIEPLKGSLRFFNNLYRDRSLWEHERETSDGLDTGAERLRREVLSRMWVPDPDHVPLRSQEDGDGIHEEMSGLRTLTWWQSGGAVKLSWVTPSTDMWLRSELFPSLGAERARDLLQAWTDIQESMCRYLNQAADYIFAVEEGLGPTIRQVEGAITLASEDNWVQNALSLIRDLPRLKNAVAEFREMIDAALIPDVSARQNE